MQKLNWSLTAFNFGPREESHKLQIEEAEDKLSEATALIKQARHSGGSGLNLDDLDEIVVEIASSLDKIRRVRNNLKGL